MEHEYLERFIKEYRDELFKFFLSNVKNPEVAEDMTHDVLLNLTRQYQKSADIQNLKSYLFTAAKNHVINYWKSAAASRLLREQYWNDIKGQEAHLAETHYEWDREVIYGYLEGQLTEQQRKIFFLNRREGLSYSEISERLNISKSTVKNHMVLALRTIREYMDKNYDKLIGLLIMLFFI